MPPKPKHGAQISNVCAGGFHSRGLAGTTVPRNKSYSPLGGMCEWEGLTCVSEVGNSNEANEVPLTLPPEGKGLLGNGPSAGRLDSHFLCLLGGSTSYSFGSMQLFTSCWPKSMGTQTPSPQVSSKQGLVRVLLLGNRGGGGVGGAGWML